MKKGVRIYDPVLVGLSLVATLLGFFFIFDAGYARQVVKSGLSIPTEFSHQLVFGAFAIAACWLGMRVPAATWRKSAAGIWWGTFLLVASVMVFGRVQNGARRWLGTEWLMIQPAEFAKLAIILFFAAHFANRSRWPQVIRKTRNWADKFDNVLVPKILRSWPALLIIATTVLIEMEPDLGTAAVFACVAIAMLIPAQVTWKSLLLFLAVCGLGTAFLVQKEPYRMERITNHFRRWDKENVDDISYQTVQSEVSIANGGLVGVGIANGRAKYILPAPTNDFITATVGEETGLLGSLGILAILGGLVWRLLWQARRATNRFSMLVLYGVGIWIGIQASVNIMMANGTLPAIGIPLPFISSGGSSLIALWFAIGICQSTLAPTAAPTEPTQKKEAPNASRRYRWWHGRSRLSGA